MYLFEIGSLDGFFLVSRLLLDLFKISPNAKSHSIRLLAVLFVDLAHWRHLQRWYCNKWNRGYPVILFNAYGADEILVARR